MYTIIILCTRQHRPRRRWHPRSVPIVCCRGSLYNNIITIIKRYRCIYSVRAVPFLCSHCCTDFTIFRRRHICARRSGRDRFPNAAAGSSIDIGVRKARARGEHFRFQQPPSADEPSLVRRRKRRSVC